MARLATLLLSAPAGAQDAAIAEGPLDAVVVTGTRTPARVSRQLAETTVIDRAQIEQATGRTLVELLGRHSGVQFWANGGTGKASAVSLRGLEARHTLLLIDGVRYGSATQGLPAWENIPLESIERIEIVRGPLSGLYGSDAVGGVVQVFTRGGAPGLHADASVTVGSRQTARLGAGLRFGGEAFDGSAQIARSVTQGFSATNAKLQPGNFNPDDDGLRQTSGSARLGAHLGSSGWRADAHLLQSDGVNRFDDGPGADSRAAVRTRVLGVQAAGPAAPGWRMRVRAARATDETETLATASAATQLGTIASVQDQLGWEHTLDTRWGTALLLAEQLRQHVSRPGAPFAVADRSITGLAAGLHGEAPAGPGQAHHWQASLRRDRNSQFGHPSTGSLGYGFDLSPAWRAAASAGTSFVQPSFNQLYFPGFGNPALQPEEGRHAEISLRWAGTAQQLRAARFGHRIRGFITPGPNPNNVDARIDGMNLAWEAQFGDWTLAASREHVDPRNDTAGNANFGRQLARRTKDSLKLQADVAQGPWRLGGTLAAFGPRFDNAANTLPVAGFATLDLRAAWTPRPGWSLALALNNAAGQAYETIRGFNQPGREAYLTLRME
jgi:vitamin B12 transporter